MDNPRISLDGLVEYYLARKVKAADIRKALRIRSGDYAAILRRNNLRRVKDPAAHAALVKDVEAHFAKPAPAGEEQGGQS
jgi:ribosomal protein RSM22 (predicted rRNA methylase)